MPLILYGPGGRLAKLYAPASLLNTVVTTPVRVFVAVTSTNIAKILNMYPRKGAIVEGADADIVVWDPKRRKTISAGDQQSVIDYNVFEGLEVEGLPRFVLSRGHVLVEEKKIGDRPRQGEFIAREPHGPVNRALSSWKEVVAPRRVERSGIPAGV